MGICNAHEYFACLIVRLTMIYFLVFIALMLVFACEEGHLLLSVPVVVLLAYFPEIRLDWVPGVLNPELLGIAYDI